MILNQPLSSVYVRNSMFKFSKRDIYIYIQTSIYIYYSYFYVETKKLGLSTLTLYFFKLHDIHLIYLTLPSLGAKFICKFNCILSNQIFKSSMYRLN